MSMVPWPVMRMVVTAGVTEPSWRNSSSPSMPGILMSVSTTSGGSARTRARASSAEVAVVTAQPHFLVSTLASRVSMSRSSSTSSALRPVISSIPPPYSVRPSMARK